MTMTIRHLDGGVTIISYIAQEKEYHVATIASDGRSSSSTSAAGSMTWLDLAKRFAQPGDNVQMDYSDYGAFDPDGSAVPDMTGAEIGGS